MIFSFFELLSYLFFPMNATFFSYVLDGQSRFLKCPRPWLACFLQFLFDILIPVFHARGILEGLRILGFQLIKSWLVALGLCVATGRGEPFTVASFTGGSLAGVVFWGSSRSQDLWGFSLSWISPGRSTHLLPWGFNAGLKFLCGTSLISQ